MHLCTRNRELVILRSASYGFALLLSLPVYLQAQDKPPTGACCYGPYTIGCVIRTEEVCATLPFGGDYLGDDTVCSPHPCHGACCVADGTCSQLPRRLCEQEKPAGVFLGYVPCDTSQCPILGACCMEGDCVHSSAEDCPPAAGFLPNTLCTETDCTGLCCLGGWEAIDGLTREECEGAPYYGDFAGSGTTGQEITACSSICCNFDGTCEWTPFHADICPQPGFFVGFGADDSECQFFDCANLAYGACCTPEGCTLRTPETCRAGDYLGDNVECLWARLWNGGSGCPSPCLADEDCDDDDFCTLEWCGAHGYCENELYSCPEDTVCSVYFARCRCTSWPPMNMNKDYLVNLVDWAVIAPCMTGPDVEVIEPCDCADGRSDGRVDLRDVKEMQFRFHP